ncbi:molybdopterin synthase sulfur carrier subunit isoform Mocs2B2 [Mus musculus]|uniref:Molybdenum cofactor synthesis 2 n=1 Tax=Mus musculus TaxID=10090 RepID=E9PVP5_MOUSE|nr:molybdopterin synthase sulfur carrier subunit isoform Mocs2B2 [Mus musculus]|eukprot:NP_001106846.1 molybdopterin synthase sulfur carrier subunit isoform Mocs2B2 [Mus musculus]
MSSLEISNSCFSPEMRLPSSRQSVEDNASEPSGKDVDDVQEKPKDIIQFTAEKLSVGEVSQLVVSPLCGAVSLFVGTTRNNFEGKKVISLEYEALVPVSEASTVIAVSSAHRAASLEAVSYAIDSLKAKVPIWKKEIYEESTSSWKRNKECFWAAGD